MTDYETLSNADLLLTARDALRGVQTDHYRTKDSKRGYNAEHIENLESDIEHWRSEVKRLEPLVLADQAAASAAAQATARAEVESTDEA